MHGPLFAEGYAPHRSRNCRPHTQVWGSDGVWISRGHIFPAVLRAQISSIAVSGPVGRISSSPLGGSGFMHPHLTVPGWASAPRHWLASLLSSSDTCPQAPSVAAVCRHPSGMRSLFLSESQEFALLFCGYFYLVFKWLLHSPSPLLLERALKTVSLPLSLHPITLLSPVLTLCSRRSPLSCRPLPL